VCELRLEGVEFEKLPSNELVKGGEVAERAFVVSVLVGMVEVFVGVFSLSLALIADGVQSFADAFVSLIVWIGLRLSRKAPDGKFHFGYYRVETFSSVVAAFFLAGLGGVILYESYLEFLSPTEIVNAEVGIVVALAATVVAFLLYVYKVRAARRYSSMALKADSVNSIKDVLTSFTAFVSLVLSRYFGLLGTDAVAGVIIALFVFTVSYSIVKEASLVLMDACQCSAILTDIADVAKSVKRVRGVHDIRMRQIGPYLMGDMHVVVDPDMTVREADLIAVQVEQRVKEEFDAVTEIKVRIEPQEEVK
jgi:cation diffusion facilitator family transporter